jgi:hypothetical protein
MSGIRLGDVPDISSIWSLAIELRDQSCYAGIKADKEKFTRLVAGMMNDKTSRVYVIVDDQDKPQGFLLGLVEELFWSRSRYGTDLAVYVREGYRHLVPRMYRQFIAWAESKPRVVRIMFGLSSGIGTEERTGRMYNQLGLTQVGGIFSKEVAKCQG